MQAERLRTLIRRIQQDDVLSLNTDEVLHICQQALYRHQCPHCPGQRGQIRRLQQQVATLHAEIAALEAAVRQPAHADPDLAPILDAVERLRQRLYPDPAGPFPTDLKGRVLRGAERRRVEDQIYAWANPTDGSKPPSWKALGDRLGGLGIGRVRSLYYQAEWRHEQAREALGALATPNASVTPEHVSTTDAADSEA